MSQMSLCSSSFGSKNYLTPNREMSSSHPIFWSQRNPLSDGRSSDLISLSYPPKSTNLCRSLLTQISAKFANFNTNYTNSSFINPIKFHKNSTIDELLSTQVLRRISANFDNDLHLEDNCSYNMSSAGSVCVCESFPTAEDSISVDIFDYSLDSDSSNERTNKIQINDSKVIDSMQNDRQRKQKRKRRRRKKKISSKSSQPMIFSPKKCFLSSLVECSNELISHLFDIECEYESSEDIDSNDDFGLCHQEFNSDLEPELMNSRLCFGSFFANNNYQSICSGNSASDEIDNCLQFSTENSTLIESNLAEESENNNKQKEMDESSRLAIDRWNSYYSDVTCDERMPSKVKFSEKKPSVRVLCVWAFAHRSARRGDWRADSERFVERCRRIEAEIGYIFSAEHRQRVFNSRFT